MDHKTADSMDDHLVGQTADSTDDMKAVEMVNALAARMDASTVAHSAGS